MIGCERGGRKREEKRMLRFLVRAVDGEVPEENQHEGVQQAVENSTCSLRSGLGYVFRNHHSLNE